MHHVIPKNNRQLLNHCQRFAILADKSQIKLKIREVCH